MKDQFLEIFDSVTKDGKDDFIFWLMNQTDFIRAPASAKGHNNYEGGLLEHSLTVYWNLLSLCQHLPGPMIPNIGTIALTALCHDICKVDFYHTTTRNVKVDGVWMQEPYYQIDDKFPVGHGEKSVIILQEFMRLTTDEIMAIRWHMGGFDDSAKSYAGGLSMTKAYEACPLCVLLHTADLLACYPKEDKRNVSL